MFKIFRDIEDLEQIEIYPHSPIFCDTETMTDEGRTSGGLYGKIRLFQLYQEEWDSVVIIDCEFIPLQEVLDLIVDSHLVFHGGAFDLHTINIKTADPWVPAELDDTLYLSRLAFNTKQRFGFYECLDYAGEADELIRSIDKKEEQKSDWSGPLSNKQKMYAAADVYYLAKLYRVVESYKDRTVYRLDIDNLKFAIEYTRHGMPVNQDTVKRMKREYTNKLEDVLESLPINPRSSVQARDYLGTKSSDADTLIELVQAGSDRAKRVQDARHFYKTLEYLSAYDRPIIKGFFQPCAALSGRFSCTGGNSFEHVNLQQMPEILHRIVEAPENWHIVYKDYSGLELRMAVAYVGEPVMAKYMRDGADMHGETAKYIFSVSEFDDAMRTVAKTFNFGLIYGAGVPTVKNTLKFDAGVIMSFEEVRDLRHKWFLMYEYFDEWHRIHKNQMNVYGYVDIETALGRRIRSYKLTDSLNLPIQGSSVECTKTSLMLLKTRYGKDMHPQGPRLINTIHDSNIMLTPADEADDWGKALSECMVDAWTFVTSELADPDIPMPHGYEHGPVWLFH
jgi:DNA polymerase I-like protein with 3'-5' exonuclease and polymerase domains